MWWDPGYLATAPVQFIGLLRLKKKSTEKKILCEKMWKGDRFESLRALRYRSWRISIQQKISNFHKAKPNQALWPVLTDSPVRKDLQSIHIWNKISKKWLGLIFSLKSIKIVLVISRKQSTAHEYFLDSSNNGL